MTHSRSVPSSRSGAKPRKAREAARCHAKAHPLPPVDALALAAELIPDDGPRRDALAHLLSGLFEAEDALRVEVFAGSTTAARALNETRRLLASLCRLNERPPPMTPAASEMDTFDVPMWVPMTPAAPEQPDDADLNAALASLVSDDDDDGK